jgi:hypothetical protein
MNDDNTNRDAEPSPASAGYGYAWQLVQNIAMAAALAAVLILVAKSLNAKPRTPQVFVTVCSGCGSEFESYGPGKPEPITKCPNCPMSEDEWEALKEQMRKRNEKP